jgi:hypothetical protein
VKTVPAPRRLSTVGGLGEDPERPDQAPTGHHGEQDRGQKHRAGDPGDAGDVAAGQG